MNANDKQVGGAHYRKAKYQHWDYTADVLANRYFEGQITRYVCRYREKDGFEGLEKSSHYLDKALELVQEGRLFSFTLAARERGIILFDPVKYGMLRETYELDGRESAVLLHISTWEVVPHLLEAKRILGTIIQDYPHA